MTEQEFRAAYPLIAVWIKKTLAEHATAARPVASFSFSRLPSYCSEQTLVSSKVVSVPGILMPPLSAMSSTDSAASSRWTLEVSRTLTRISFAPTSLTRNPSISTNWSTSSSGGSFGPEHFLALYADGLERFGYREGPLEVMAYEFQDRFEHGARPFSVEAACQKFLRGLTSDGSRAASLGRV